MTAVPSRRRPARVVVAACVAVVALATAGWMVASARHAAAVVVLLPVDALTCEGTTVDGGDGPVPVAQIAEGMRCRLAARIENRSPVDVIVERLSVPFLGPSGGPGVEAVAIDGAATAPREGQVDATFDLAPARTLAAGSAGTFAVVVELRPGGCTPEGSTLTLRGEPSVVVRVLGRSHGRSAVGDGFGFRGTAATTCSP